MPKLSEHQSAEVSKILYIGDSSTGKTGSLTSLVAAGYKVRVLDMDNGLESLIHFINRDCPKMVDNVDFVTLRDKYSPSPTGATVKPGAARAFVKAVKYFDKWEDESDPSEWGKDTILVVDSGTSLGKAAFEWAKGMNPDAKDPRQWYFAAQQAFENIIAMLTSAEFHTNLIFISHISYRELQDGTTKGYASAIGSALGPTIAKYFNTVILCETSGTGKNLRRTIRTVPTSMVDLKNPTPFSIDETLPLESGLVTIFEKLKERTA